MAAEHDMIHERLEHLDIQLHTLEKEREIVISQSQHYSESAATGTIPQLDRERMEREVLRITNEHLELQSRKKNSLAELQDIELREEEMLAKRRRDAAVRLTEIEYELVGLEQQQAGIAARIERSEIRSDTGGLIQRLEIANPLEVIAPGDLIAEIVPNGVSDRAELEICADRIGAIRPGMPAKLKILSYDFTRFGVVHSKVIEVSPTSYLNELGELVFHVTVVLPAQANAQFNGQGIRSGMRVIGDITRGEKTVLAYLLKPLRVLSDRSLSES